MAQGSLSLPPRTITSALEALRNASLLHLQGRLAEAERGFQFVLAGDDRNFEALYRLGMIRIQQGRFGDAADFLRRALRINRQSADAYHSLAIALSGLKRHEEALTRYRKALALNPDLPEAHNNIAHSLHALGRLTEAAGHYERALGLRPDYPEAKNNLGTLLEARDQLDQALDHYLAAAALRPHYVEAHKNAGRLLGELGRHDEAILHYEQALALRPDDIDSLIRLGTALHALDRPDAAIAQYRKALARDPACVTAHIGIGNVAHGRGHSEEAILHYAKGLGIDRSHVDAHSKLGEALLALGRIREAEAAFERAVELAPRHAGHYWNLALSRRFAEHDQHFLTMQRLARNLDRLNQEEQVDLHFALGKAFADVGDPHRSFEHVLAGNALMRRRVAYDERVALARFERIRSTFTADLMRGRAGQGDATCVPVFIVGMPRSGTTLIEQILASHSKVFGSGELREMSGIAERIGGAEKPVFPEAVATMSDHELNAVGREYVHAVRRMAPTAERITDKMPGNFALLGLIRLALPNARIIHACRDVRDTAFSCFSLLFSGGHTYSYDLAELGRYCRAYLDLMQHWREVLPGAMLEVRYEDVVADLETQARRIIAFCGLEWEHACLEFHRTARSVRTASAAQVRNPIYQTSIGRWRAHESALQPLLRSLE